MGSDIATAPSSPGPPAHPVDVVSTVDRLRAALRLGGPAIAVLIVQLVVFPLPAGAWLQGAIIGLLNALVVLGLMLVWRANRVLNLAQASMGAYPGALGAGIAIIGGLGFGASLGLGVEAAVVVGIAVALVTRRSRVWAIGAGLFTLVSATGGLFALSHAGYVGGLVVGLATAVLVGVGTDLFVVQRFGRSPRLILTVATIGLAQFFAVGALLVPRLWHENLLVKGSGAGGYGVPFHLRFAIGQQVFRSDDVVAVVVALACFVGVAAILRRTDVGIAVRASADRRDRAAMLGVPV
ncbi:MAG TPA: hypothetical protein VGM93_09780, partial [Acidimicrobiales bacterium]